MTEREFNTIFDYYRMSVFNFVNKLLRNRHDAEEVTSSVFIKLWKTQPEIITDEKTKAWLFITAKRKALDKIKSINLRQSRETPLPITTIEEYIDPKEITPDTHCILMNKILEIIKTYTKQEQLVFDLHFVQDLKLGDISKILRSRPQTISNQLTTIRKKLKSQIKTGQ